MVAFTPETTKSEEAGAQVLVVRAEKILLINVGGAGAGGLAAPVVVGAAHRGLVAQRGVAAVQSDGHAVFRAEEKEQPTMIPGPP